VIKKLILGLLVGAMCLSAAAALAYNEAPMLRVKVAAGELPPVEERLPEEPSVVEPLEEIGQYGGTLYVFPLNPSPWNDLQESTDRGMHIGRMAEDGTTVLGDLAKGFDFSEDSKSLTIYLREGAKWSDGYPFTADDVVFMFEDMHWNDKVKTWNWLLPVKRAIKIDDYTVRLETDEPYPGLLPRLVTPAGGDWCAYHPKHYLKKWHIRYNPDADKLAKEEGFDNWWEAFFYHYWWAPTTDLDKPTMQPWILTEFTTTTKVFERNPYYVKVDTAGNQLPYADRIVSTIVDPEVYQMKIIAGEASVAYVNTSFDNYPLYKENEEAGGYQVNLIPGISYTDVGFGLNLNQSDPIKRKLYQDVRFRQALSLAINRAEINDSVFFGRAVPRQMTTLPSSSFYKPEWAEAYAQYDPEEANRLLDEIGLTERDENGFRKRSDGKTVFLLVEHCPELRSVPISALELVKEYWEAVGLKVLVKALGGNIFWDRQQDPDHDIIATNKASTEIREYLIQREDWVCGSSYFAWAPTWGLWLGANADVKAGVKTLEDFEGGKLPGEEPPQEIKTLFQWGEELAQTRIGSKEYKDLWTKICDFHAENLLIIGAVGMVPVPYIAKKNIGNVPKVFPPAAGGKGDLIRTADQLFIKQ